MDQTHSRYCTGLQVVLSRHYAYGLTTGIVHAYMLYSLVITYLVLTAGILHAYRLYPLVITCTVLTAGTVHVNRFYSLVITCTVLTAGTVHVNMFYSLVITCTVDQTPSRYCTYLQVVLFRRNVCTVQQVLIHLG